MISCQREEETIVSTQDTFISMTNLDTLFNLKIKIVVPKMGKYPVLGFYIGPASVLVVYLQLDQYRSH